MTTQVNSEGAPIGPGGYVLCRACGKECKDISRETTLEAALCAKDRDSKHHSHSQGENTMSTATAKPRRTSTAKIPDPIQFLKDMLGKAQGPLTRDEVKKRMEKATYQPGTISTQIFQLRHWKGCTMTKDGEFTRNDSYVEPVRDIKEKKEKKARAARVSKERKGSKPRTKKAGNFHPQPKPSQKESVTA
jgi:hypothetical protein